MKTTVLTILETTAAFVLILSTASADLVVDQVADAFNAPSPSGELGGPTIADFQSSLQTFSVGVTGVLAGIDLQVQQSDAPSVPDSDLVLSILTTTAGVPDLNQNLGSVNLPVASIPVFDNFSSGEFVSFDVSNLGISVSPGDVLAFELSYPAGNGSYFIYDSEVDIYGGGTSFVFGPLDGFFGDTSPRDLGFRTVVSTIPEPSSYLLIVSCLFASLAVRNRHESLCI